jgi:heptosyltransferase I
VAPPFHLCILRLSAIGDVCHAAAMVNAILRHKPTIKITWVIGKVEYQLMKYMPNIHFVVYDKEAGNKARVDVKKALADFHFDALFVMQVALRANWLSRVINAKRRIGFDYERSREGHSLFVNERIAPRLHAHVLDGFMGFAEVLGIPPLETPEWNIRLLENDLAWIANALPQEYAVISPAASNAERNWLPERYAQIADYISEQGIAVILCGSSSELDQQTSAAIMSHTNNISYNLVGQTTLIRLLAVLNKASFVVAPDTGPAHMATTQGTPVVGLYAHSNPRRTGPYNSLDTTSSAYDLCIQQQFGKPWQALAWGKRAIGTDLMNEISVGEVKALIEKVLEIKRKQGIKFA